MITFAQALEEYLAHIRVEKNYSKHTIEAYQRHLKAWISACGSADCKVADCKVQEKLLSVKSVEPASIRKFVIDAVGKQKSISFQNQAFSAIKQFLRFAHVMGYLTEDPSRHLELSKRPKMLPKLLTESQVFTLLEAPDIKTPLGLRDRALIETLYGSGMRVSEAVELQISQLSLDAGTLQALGKRGKERLIPITERTLFWLKTYIAEVRNPLWADLKQLPYVFLSTGGRHLSRVHAWRLIQKYAKAVGIRQCSPHTLRHAFASHLVQHGADLRSIQTLLGHQSLQSTEIYTHVGPKHLRDLIDQYHLLGG